MNVQELFRRLSLGELSNLSMSNSGDGTIRAADKPKIILHANTALQVIFTRFILKENQVILQTNLEEMTYYLSSTYAVSNEDPLNEAERYITDNVAEPFSDDVVRVLEIYDEDGRKIPLNHSDNELSIFTPAPTTVQVPVLIRGSAFALSYQCYHPALVDNDETQTIAIPRMLEPALTSFIAAEVYGDMNTQESKITAMGHEKSFSDLLTMVEQQDLLSSARSNLGTKFANNGWV